MEEKPTVSDAVFAPMIQTIHFYAAMIAGWWVFHYGIYPLAYFAKGAGSDLAAQLPIYAVNVMAFGCLIYVATRPVILLVVALSHEFERAVIKINKDR